MFGYEYYSTKIKPKYCKSTLRTVYVIHKPGTKQNQRPLPVFTCVMKHPGPQQNHGEMFSLHFTRPGNVFVSCFLTSVSCVWMNLTIFILATAKLDILSLTYSKLLFCMGLFMPVMRTNNFFPQKLSLNSFQIWRLLTTHSSKASLSRGFHVMVTIFLCLYTQSPFFTKFFTCFSFLKPDSFI